MASKPLSVHYFAYDISSCLNDKPINQAIASILSLRTSHSELFAKGSGLYDIELAISKNYSDCINAITPYGLFRHAHTVKYSHSLIPTLQCNAILDAFLRSETDYVLTVDNDTVFLKQFLQELLLCMDRSGCDIAMAHECGSTGITPYPNFNCGFLLMKRNRKNEELLRCWYQLCITNPKIIPHGNQRLFPYALATINPRIFPLDQVYNLRCHPVFDNISQVWSPVYMVHNHSLSNYWSDLCLEIMRLAPNEIEFADALSKSLSQVDQHFTPSSNPFIPRFVSAIIP